jgi:hypothetical protein
MTIKKINYLHMKNLFFAILTVLSLGASAQQGVFQPGDYKDGIYDKENAVNRRFIPYTHLREGDVTWEKRVWRDIDMREKVLWRILVLMQQEMRFQRKCLLVTL